MYSYVSEREVVRHWGHFHHCIIKVFTHRLSSLCLVQNTRQGESPSPGSTETPTRTPVDLFSPKNGQDLDRVKVDSNLLQFYLSHPPSRPVQQTP